MRRSLGAYILALALAATLVHAQSGIQSTNLGSQVPCANQGPLGAVTGTAALLTVYTCTIPAGGMRVAGGIEVLWFVKHTTGTAAVLYQVTFGGTATTASQPSGSANQLTRGIHQILNNTGSQSAQTMHSEYVDSASGSVNLKLDTAAIATTSPVVVNLQFNVAATDAITPEQFIIRYVQ